MLCGASPIQASSGKTTRHRLNRGGDRQANAALYRIVLVRLCYDPATKDYMARRLKQGKSKKEIIRCLKRYVARSDLGTTSEWPSGPDSLRRDSHGEHSEACTPRRFSPIVTAWSRRPLAQRR
jgi:hypothetical protein